MRPALAGMHVPPQAYYGGAYSTQPGQQGSVPPCVFPPGCMFGGQPLAALLQALPSLECSASRTSYAALLQVVSQTMVRAMGLGRLAGLCHTLAANIWCHLQFSNALIHGNVSMAAHEHLPRTKCAAFSGAMTGSFEWSGNTVRPTEQWRARLCSIACCMPSVLIALVQLLSVVANSSPSTQCCRPTTRHSLFGTRRAFYMKPGAQSD